MNQRMVGCDVRIVLLMIFRKNFFDFVGIYVTHFSFIHIQYSVDDCLGFCMDNFVMFCFFVIGQVFVILHFHC